MILPKMPDYRSVSLLSGGFHIRHVRPARPWGRRVTAPSHPGRCSTRPGSGVNRNAVCWSARPGSVPVSLTCSLPALRSGLDSGIASICAQPRRRVLVLALGQHRPRRSACWRLQGLAITALGNHDKPDASVSLGFWACMRKRHFCLGALNVAREALIKSVFAELVVCNLLIFQDGEKPDLD